MRTFVFALMVLGWWLGALFGPVADVQAQDAPVEQVAQLQIDLWPEFDRPAMLVIYRITLRPETPLPVRLSLRLPQRAGRPNAVATASSPDVMLVNAAYEYVPATGSPWAWVHVTVNQPYVQVEYYDPALEKQGDQRAFTYTWPGDVGADQVVVQLQQPWNATDLEVQPPLDPLGVTDVGLQLYEKNFGPLSAGQTLTLEIRYSKPDDVLTIQYLESVQQQQQPVGAPGAAPAAPPAATETPPDTLDLLSQVLIGLGVVALGVAGWFWWQGRSRVKVSRRTPKPASAKGKAARYCPACGTKALPGARFCHRCGTPLP